MKKISKKDLINQIKLEANKIDVPDLKEQIKMNLEYQKLNTSPTNEPVHRKSRFPFVRFSIGFIAIILIFSIPLFAKSLIPSDIYVPTEKPKPKEIYAFQTASMLSFVGNNSKVLNMEDILIDYEKEADGILSYLGTVESIFLKDSGVYTLEELKDSSYQYKMTLNLTLFESNNIYTLYFNELPISDEDDDDLDEVSTRLNGYVLINTKRYDLEGKKEIANNECEIEMTLYLNDEHSNYIKLEQEIENSENEYTYEFYENNQLTSSLEIELVENGNNKTIELEKFDSKMASEIEYEFVYFDDHIEVEYEDDNNEYEVTISFTQDEYVFDFGEDKIILKSRKNKKISNFTNNSVILIVL